MESALVVNLDTGRKPLGAITRTAILYSDLAKNVVRRIKRPTSICCLDFFKSETSGEQFYCPVKTKKHITDCNYEILNQQTHKSTRLGIKSRKLL